MLFPLSKQLGRKPASALENQKLGVHRYKMFFFLAILGLFKICKPTYAKKYHCFYQKKKTLTGLVHKFCQLKQKCKFVPHKYIIENIFFAFKTRKTISVQTDHRCFSERRK